MKLISALVLAAMLAGCAAIGPTGSSEFPLLIQAAIPPKYGQVRIFGSGNWYPNTKGFTPFRSGLLARAPEPIPGAMAITDTHLFFLQWNETTKAFDPIKRVDYIDVDSVSLDTHGVGRRIVVQRHDYSVDSFELTRAAGNLVDGEKVERAVQLIASRLVIVRRAS